jgi:hypothetical protein
MQYEYASSDSLHDGHKPCQARIVMFVKEIGYDSKQKEIDTR